MKKTHLLGAIIAWLCTFTTLSAQAVTVPAGLSPGDTYQLVFVTAGTTNAQSTNIADYNSFVQTEAALNAILTGTDIGVTYSAIGSTLSVDANTNALVSAPVYIVDGSALVATGYGDMWDGTLNAPISQNQFGATLTSGNVWSGSLSVGTVTTTCCWLGATEIGVQQGRSDLTSGWLTNGGAAVATGQGNMFALSSVITVSAVPVPAAVWLFGSGLLGLVGVARRKKA
jgi:hypothetical protein